MEKFDIDGLASRPTILLTTVVSALGQEYESEKGGTRFSQGVWHAAQNAHSRPLPNYAIHSLA
jgi:hypothetical protein